MNRLCIIGNSHTAALKLAWDEMSDDFPHVQITFFAARGSASGQLLVREGCLEAGNEYLKEQLAMTSGGRISIDPNEYDAFLAYGTMSYSLKAQRADDYSAAFARAATIDRTRNSLKYRHISYLREVTEKPVFAAMAPLPSLVDGVASQMLLPYRTGCELIQQELLTPLDVVLIQQPEETLLDCSATREEFTVGSVRLADVRKRSGQHPDGEATHMNKGYGNVWLRSFLHQWSSNFELH